LSFAAWFCSPEADIRQDVEKYQVGSDRIAVEDVIKKLYYPIRDEDLGNILQKFWKEYDDFKTRRGISYQRAFIWETDEIKQGNSHLWHKLYSIPFTDVFGKVACRVCSKPLGCGPAERNWGSLKHLKSGQRSHLSADKAQKQATVYGAASIDKARMIQAAEEKNGYVLESRWTDADLAFAHGLEDWDGGPGNVPEPLVPKRIFNAWIEDWEWDLLHHNDPVSEARLLQKYVGLRWIDPDEGRDELTIVDHECMEYQGGRNAPGWCVIGVRDSDGVYEPWQICGGDVIDLIAAYEQPAELNVEVVINEELRAANEQRIIEQENRKKHDAEQRKKAASSRKRRR
jgi:hypothetical protein